MSDRYICEVYPVYVRPQSMTDEQACIGVIVRCPQIGFRSYRLVTSDEKIVERILNFFPSYGRERLDRALAWAKNDIERAFAIEQDTGDDDAFRNLVRPRENAVRYGALQVVSTDDPDREVDDLYRRSVEH